MKQLALSALIELPDDTFDAAEIVARIKAPWRDLMAALQSADVPHKMRCDEMEVRPKRVRTRRPRLVPPGEAA